jgi:hypothetical protein
MTDHWPTRPRRLKHAVLGKRILWQRLDGRARVVRFSEGSGRYLGEIATLINGRVDAALAVTRLIGDFPSLVRAERACDRALRALLPSLKSFTPRRKAAKKQEA